jgi:hypothetical protein
MINENIQNTQRMPIMETLFHEMLTNWLSYNDMVVCVIRNTPQRFAITWEEGRGLFHHLREQFLVLYSEVLTNVQIGRLADIEIVPTPRYELISYWNNRDDEIEQGVNHPPYVAASNWGAVSEEQVSQFYQSLRATEVVIAPEEHQEEFRTEDFSEEFVENRFDDNSFEVLPEEEIPEPSEREVVKSNAWEAKEDKRRAERAANNRIIDGFSSVEYDCVACGTRTLKDDMVVSCIACNMDSCLHCLKKGKKNFGRKCGGCRGNTMEIVSDRFLQNFTEQLRAKFDEELKKEQKVSEDLRAEVRRVESAAGADMLRIRGEMHNLRMQLTRALAGPRDFRRPTARKTVSNTAEPMIGNKRKREIFHVEKKKIFNITKIKRSDKK